MKKEKSDKGLMRSALDKASYSVGFVCAKVARIGEITDDRRWKRTVSASKGFMEKAAEKTSVFLEDAKEGASHIKESFMSGFESAKEKIAGHGAAHEAVPSSRVGAKAKPGSFAPVKSPGKVKAAKKNLTSQEKKKLRELSAASLDPDLEKEIARIDGEVSDVSG